MCRHRHAGLLSSVNLQTEKPFSAHMLKLQSSTCSLCLPANGSGSHQDTDGKGSKCTLQQHSTQSSRYCHHRPKHHPGNHCLDMLLATGEPDLRRALTEERTTLVSARRSPSAAGRVGRSPFYRICSPHAAVRNTHMRPLPCSSEYCRPSARPASAQSAAGTHLLHGCIGHCTSQQQLRRLLLLPAVPCAAHSKGCIRFCWALSWFESHVCLASGLRISCRPQLGRSCTLPAGQAPAAAVALLAAEAWPPLKPARSLLQGGSRCAGVSLLLATPAASPPRHRCGAGLHGDRYTPCGRAALPAVSTSLVSISRHVTNVMVLE
jgi:hypothetical protein